MSLVSMRPFSHPLSKSEGSIPGGPVDFFFWLKDNKCMRIVSLIVLIVVALMFTGLTSYAATAPIVKSEKSCCDECNKKDEGNKSDHCSTPTCPMFLCLSMNIVTPFTPSIQTESVFLTNHAKEFHLSISTKPIFHPPVIV